MLKDFFKMPEVKKEERSMKIEINLDEILQKIDELKEGIAEAKFILKKGEESLEKEELKLQALLEKVGVKEMDHGIYSFGWKETKRKAFDQKLFGEKHPELLDQFKIEKTSEKFEVKINK